jgi:hypothetical protein
MNYKLRVQFDRLEKARHDVIKLISPIDETDFMKEKGNKWSLGQILIHIVTSEKLALQYMRKKSLGVDSIKDSGFVEPMKLMVLKISQRLPIKYKAPKIIREKTPQPVPKTQLIRLWDESRSDLRKFLESIEDKNVNKKIFKHPIAGMFNASQGVAFLREHLLHHKPQILRLSKSHLSAKTVRSS